MSPTQQLTYSLLLVLLGYLLRGAVQGRWRRNPKHHHAADAQHCWVEIAGVWHAFTDDACATARARAEILVPWFRHRWLRPLIALAVCGLILALLGGCKTTDKAGPRVVVAPTGPATRAELDSLNEQIAEMRKSFQAQRDLAQLAAGAVYGAIEANLQNPMGLPREATAAQLEEAARALPAPTDAQRLEKAEQNARILAGELVAVKAEMGQKSSQIDALQASLSASQAREAELARETARLTAAAVREREAAAAKFQAEIDAERARTAAAHDQAKKEALQLLGKVLLGLGAALMLAGVGIAFVSKGVEWERALIAAGGGASFFACYWTLNQPWFKWVVIGTIASGLGAGVWWLIRERKVTVRQKEADEAEDTLKRIIGAVDQLGDTATVAQIRQAMSAGMNDNHKALVHELRAETKRVPA
jgi:hypothetical protein